MADENGRAVRRIPILLSTKQRWASGLFGVAAAGAGSTATFITANQAGATTLLLAGFLGLLMSLTGRVPDRIGREGIVHEAIDGPAARTLADVVVDPELPVQKRREIADTLRDEVAEERRRPTAWPHSSHVLSTALYEFAVQSALEEAIPNGAAIEPNVRVDGTRVDAAILPVGSRNLGRGLAIEVRARVFGKYSRAGVEQVVRLLREGFGAVLVISPIGQRLELPDEFHSRTVRTIEFGMIAEDHIEELERDRAALRRAVTELWASLQ